MSGSEVVAQGDWRLARESSAVAAPRHELSVADLVDQLAKVKQVMKDVMKDSVHYGTIPGTEKPCLYQPGAQTLCLLFRLDPQFESVQTFDGRHLTVKSKCTLYHIATGERRGSGEGSCSTREVKYAYRKANRACPACGVEAIIKGKDEYGGGWLCFKKKDGCGAKYRDGDPKIESQAAGRVDNEDIADSYNTVLKISNKRALTAAVLNVTAASDTFTQDLEDLQGLQEEYRGRISADPQPAPTAPAKINRFRTPITPEEMERMREQTRQAQAAGPRPAVEVEPPEAGFGDPPPAEEGQALSAFTGPGPGEPRYGAALSAQQLKILHTKIGEKEKQLGLIDGTIKRKLLEEYRINSSKELGQDVWTEINVRISRFRREDAISTKEAK